MKTKTRTFRSGVVLAFVIFAAGSAFAGDRRYELHGFKVYNPITKETQDEAFLVDRDEGKAFKMEFYLDDTQPGKTEIKRAWKKVDNDLAEELKKLEHKRKRQAGVRESLEQEAVKKAKQADVSNKNSAVQESVAPDAHSKDGKKS